MGLRDRPLLHLVEGVDVGGLHVVLHRLDLLTQHVRADEVVDDDGDDAQLLDTVADRDELRTGPTQTLHLDLTHFGLELLHVRVRAQGLDVQNQRRTAGLLLLALGRALIVQLLGLLRNDALALLLLLRQILVVLLMWFLKQ